MTGRKVTVCGHCFMASCWHGVFMCDESRNAGTIEKDADELDKLQLEHPSYYSEENITKVTERVDYELRIKRRNGSKVNARRI